MEDQKFQNNIIPFGELSPYTCPECHGVLTGIKEGSRIRFRCHTGHAFSADTLLSSLTLSIEENLWNAIRALQESILFLNHVGDHFAERDEPKTAALYFKKAKEAEQRLKLVKGAVFSHERLSINGINTEAENIA